MSIQSKIICHSKCRFFSMSGFAPGSQVISSSSRYGGVPETAASAFSHPTTLVNSQQVCPKLHVSRHSVLQVFVDLSTGTVPSITNLEHAFRQSALRLLSTWTCHLSLHLLIASRIAFTPLICSSDLSLSETPHNYQIIIISVLSIFESRSALTAHISHLCKQFIIHAVCTWLNTSPTNSGNYPQCHTSPSTYIHFSVTSDNYYTAP